jgi:hypothetical protein
MLILNGFYPNRFYKKLAKKLSVWQSAAGFDGHKLKKPNQTGAMSITCGTSAKAEILVA